MLLLGLMLFVILYLSPKRQSEGYARWSPFTKAGWVIPRKKIMSYVFWIVLCLSIWPIMVLFGIVPAPEEFTFSNLVSYVVHYVLFVDIIMYIFDAKRWEDESRV